MEYKQYVVALIIFVCLICIMYPSPTCVRDRSYEQYVRDGVFSEKDLHSYRIEQIQICARNISVVLYDKIVRYCVMIMDYDRMPTCIMQHLDRYEADLQKPIYDMYDKNIRFTGSDSSDDDRQQIVSKLLNVVKNSLHRLLTKLTVTYQFNNYDRERFIALTTRYLTDDMVSAILPAANKD